MPRYHLGSRPSVVDLVLDRGQELDLSTRLARLAGRTYHLLPADNGTWAVFITKGGLKERLKPHADFPSHDVADDRGNWRLPSFVALKHLTDRLRLDLGDGAIRDAPSEAVSGHLAVALSPRTGLSLDAGELHRYFSGARLMQGLIKPVTSEEQRSLENEPTDASAVRPLSAAEGHARTIGKVIVINKLTTPGTRRGQSYPFAASVKQGGQLSNLDTHRHANCVYGPDGLTYLREEDVVRTGVSAEKQPSIYRLMAENMAGKRGAWLEPGLERNLGSMVDALSPGEAIRFDVSWYVVSAINQREFDPGSVEVVESNPVLLPSAASAGLDR